MFGLTIKVFHTSCGKSSWIKSSNDSYTFSFILYIFLFIYVRLINYIKMEEKILDFLCYGIFKSNFTFYNECIKSKQVCWGHQINGIDEAWRCICSFTWHPQKKINFQYIFAGRTAHNHFSLHNKELSALHSIVDEHTSRLHYQLILFFTVAD